MADQKEVGNSFKNEFQSKYISSVYFDVKLSAVENQAGEISYDSAVPAQVSKSVICVKLAHHIAFETNKRGAWGW